jgi:hypothetical protein
MERVGCDRCRRPLSYGQGYISWSVLNPDWAVVSSDKIGEQRLMLLCENCANHVFTKENWDAASRISLTKENLERILSIDHLTSPAEAKPHAMAINNLGMAIFSIKRGLSAESAKQEAQETARLYWGDKK